MKMHPQISLPQHALLMPFRNILSLSILKNFKISNKYHLKFMQQPFDTYNFKDGNMTKKSR